MGGRGWARVGADECGGSYRWEGTHKRGTEGLKRSCTDTNWLAQNIQFIGVSV